MLQFQGFKPAAMQRMAKSIGFEGDMQEFNKFLDDNPDKQEKMNVYSEKAKEMMMGGYVKGYANGGVVEKDYRAEYQAAVESARQARANGMMGRVVLPGEMPYEDFAANRRNMDQLTAQYGPSGGLQMATPQGNPSTGGVVQAPGMENIPGTLSYEQALNRQMSRDVKQPWEAKRIAAALALGPGTRYTIPPENMAEMEQAFASQMSQGQMSSQLISSGPQRPLPADFRIFKGGPKGPGTEQGNPSTGMINLSTGMPAGQQPTGPAPVRNRENYEKLKAETAAMRRRTGFMGQVVLPGEEPFEEYMSFGPTGPGLIASPNLPPLLQQPRPAPPIDQRNPNIEAGYYDSPEAQKARDYSGPSNMAVGYNPYFGMSGSSTNMGGGYEEYLKRTGKTSYLQGGADYVENPEYTEYRKSQDDVGPLQIGGPNDQLPQFPEATLPYNPTPPPGGYPKFKDPRLEPPPTTMPVLPTPPPGGYEKGFGDESGGVIDFERSTPTATAPPVGPVDYTQGPVPQSTGYQGGTIAEAISNRAFNPAMPYGTTVQPVGTAYDANQAVDTTLGQVSAAPDMSVAQATSMGAVAPVATDPRTMTAETAANEIGIATDTLTAAQGAVDPRAVVAAQSTVDTGVSTLDAVQGTSILMSNPNQRKVQTGELVSGAANAQTASTFTEQVQAAEATPTNKATIQGQLEGLLQSFEGGNTPAWAAGAMRNVSAQMANRGLGASSMAAQALIQGAMESALPIAQADAQIIAQFEAQNLSNRQQRAMLAAQQRATFMGMEFDQSFQARVQNSARIGDIANMNFTADQQVALENSRVANTVNLQNLNNSQAMVMAEAAALSQLDMANLSNRQQSAVMNAQSFMQMDMANLSSQQQTEMFKAQSRIQSLFTDQAAENAAKQFNATSQNQTDQFFASLASTTSQFNAAQSNAQSQFNAGQTNAMSEFQASIKNQRDQFNAQNRLVIDQNNAQWRRQIATADTVAINRANEINATNLLGMSTQAYNDLWQYYSDSMEFAWTSVENEQERMNKLAQIQLTGDVKMKVQDLIGDQAAAKGFGNMITEMFVGGTGFLPGLFKKG